MKKFYGLLCKGEKLPLAIINEARFNWESVSGQTGYSVRITLNGETVFEKKEEGDAPFCYLRGLSLLPFKKYDYEITVYAGGKAVACGNGEFISGKENAFAGVKWISDGRHFIADSDEIGSAASYYKKVFGLEKVSDPAVVTMCGLGLHELYINGVKADDRVLEPAFTEYDKLALYSSYNVTSLLKNGENVLEFTLADGWYNQTTKDTWGFYRAPWREYPKAALTLDCGEFHLESDESFSVSYGEIKRSALRLGEVIDFNAERKYSPVCVVPPPGGKLTPAYLPPIRERQKISPVSVYPGDNCTVYDFGVNIAGYASATLFGEKGAEARITYSDRIKDGKCDNASNSMYIYNAPAEDYQADICVLSGRGDEYKPKFVYHGFRYMTVSGNARAENVFAYFVHTDLKRGGEFGCSSEILDKLYDMSIRAILSNYHGMPTDCPHREKNGWTGDAQLSLETCVLNFDMQDAYEKWVGDILVAQRPSGQIPSIIPTCGWGYNWGSGPAWDVAFFRIVYALWYYYGNEEIAKKCYPALKRYYEYLSAYENDGLLNVGLGDWNRPQRITFNVCSGYITDSCIYAYMSETLAEFADKFAPEEAEYYRSRAEKVKADVLAKYGDDQSLTGLAALTYFGVADRTEEVVRYLENNDYAPHFGIQGAKYVLSVLGKAGRTDVGVKLLSRTEYPSFGYWIEHGQTTLCEDFELTNSLNHHMYSCVAEFMTRYICGVSVGKNGAVEINPRLPYNLGYANASVTTIRGKFSVGVKRVSDKIKVIVTVPDGATALCGNKFFGEGTHEYEI